MKKGDKMTSGKLGIETKIQFESIESVSKKLEKIIEKLSKNAEIDTKVNTSSAQNDLEKIYKVIENIDFEKISTIDLSQITGQIDGLSEKLNQDLGAAKADPKWIGKMEIGLSVLDTALATFDATMDDTLTTTQKFSTGLQGIGSSLMMIPNAYTMAAGAIATGVGSIIGYLDKWKTKQDEIFTNARENIDSLSDEMSTLQGFGDEYDKLRSQIENYSDITKLSKEEQGNLYGIMEKIAKLHPELIVGYDKQGRVITDLTKSSKELYDKQYKLLEVEMERAKIQASKDLDEIPDQIENKQTELNEKKEHIEYLKTLNVKDSPGADPETVSEEMKITEAEIKVLESELQNLGELQKNLTNFINGTTEAINDSNTPLKITTDLLKTMFDEANTGLANATENLEKYEGYLEKLNNGDLTLIDMSDMLKDYPEWISLVDDELELREALKNAISEQENAQINAISNMLLASENFYNEVTSKNKNMIKELADDYYTDLSNVKTLAEAKLRIENELIKKISKKWADYYDATTDTFDYGAIYRLEKIDSKYAAELMNDVNSHRARKKELADKLNEIANEHGDFDLGEYKPSNGNSSAKTKIEIDLLADLNRQLDENTNKTNKLNQVLEEIPENDESRIAYLNQENELLKERQGILHELANKHRETIASSKALLKNEGVSFIDDNVDYESYKSVLDSLDNQTGTENRINSIQQAFKNLIDTQTKEIPGLQQEWRELYKSIKENEVQINNIELSKFDNQLEELENQMKLLGEVDTIEEINKRSMIFAQQQDILRQKLIAVNSQISEYSQKLRDTSETTEAGAINATVFRKEIERLNGLKSDIEINIFQKQEQERKRMLEIVKEVEDTVVDIVKKGIEEEKDAEDDRHRNMIENLNKEKEKWEDVYDAKLKALEEEQEEIEHAESMEELLNEKAEIQDQINKLMLDDSMEANAKKKSLSEQLSDIEKRIADETRNYEFKQREDAINKEKEQKLAYIEEEIEAENMKHEEYIDDLDEKLEADNLYAEAHKILMNEKYKEISSMIQEHQKKWGQNFSIIGDTIENGMVAQLREALDLMRELGASKNNHQIDYDNNISKPPEFANMPDSLYRQYTRNKGDWITADKATQEKLANRNQKIRDTYGINGDNYSYSDLINWGRNAKVSLNSITTSSINTIPNRNIKAASKTTNNLTIDSLVKVNGNVTKEAIPELEKMTNAALGRLRNTFNNHGIHRQIV